MPNIRPKLSLLVPAYNVEQFIEECLDSINSQINNDCEVIVYDDGSTDRTITTIQNSAIFTKPNFRLVIGDKNRGLSFARNTLTNLASGEYIWFMDSDDKILNNSITKLLNCIKTKKPDTILFDIVLWRDSKTINGNPIGPLIKTYHRNSGLHHTTPAALFAEILRNGHLYTPAKVYNRKLFSYGIEFPLGRIFEDIPVTPLLTCQSKTIYYIDEPLFAYRTRSGSITNSIKEDQAIQPLISIEELKYNYEKIFGTLDEDASNALIYFLSIKFNRAIKDLEKKDKASIHRKEIIKTYKRIHGKSLTKLLYICIKEDGIKFSYKITKRLIETKLNIIKSKA